MKTKEEILSEIGRLNKIDNEWCNNPDLSNLEDGIKYQARREALYWVLEKEVE